MSKKWETVAKFDTYDLASNFRQFLTTTEAEKYSNIDLVKIKRSKKDDTFSVKVWSKPPEKPAKKKKKRVKNENQKVCD